MRLETAPSSVTQFNTLRNAQTGLVYQPSKCPRGIAAANHWVPADGLPFDGVTARCLCGET